MRISSPQNEEWGQLREGKKWISWRVVLFLDWPMISPSDQINNPRQIFNKRKKIWLLLFDFTWFGNCPQIAVVKVKRGGDILLWWFWLNFGAWRKTFVSWRGKTWIMKTGSFLQPWHWRLLLLFAPFYIDLSLNWKTGSAFDRNPVHLSRKTEAIREN